MCSTSWILVRAIDELYGTTYTMHNSAIKSEARCRPFEIERCAHITIATKQAVQENYERTNAEKELRALSRVSPAIVPLSGSTMLHNHSPSPRILIPTTILGEQEPSSLLEVSCPRDTGSIPPTILLLPLEIIWPQRISSISILIHT
ncbi:hypothetical protein BS47DRAFT_267011 [Hydnum rufescens UP504]|uniref:Uncharacterized protein n=1 Tax=Hydnum rufescens UP504 TaxID=1448309 RepID=A0A9P6ALA2_9AGAM|nr:hypothetical protein BS47DRAFT_267011 [Hydnum rufescens UP504]